MPWTMMACLRARGQTCRPAALLRGGPSAAGRMQKVTPCLCLEHATADISRGHRVSQQTCQRVCIYNFEQAKGCMKGAKAGGGWALLHQCLATLEYLLASRVKQHLVATEGGAA